MGMERGNKWGKCVDIGSSVWVRIAGQEGHTMEALRTDNGKTVTLHEAVRQGIPSILYWTTKVPLVFLV
jgi:hypothetical protein